MRARATSVVPMTVRDLVDASDAALRGRVQRIGSAIDPLSGAVHTYVVLEPEDVLFGSLPAGEVVLREVGGQVGGRRQWVFGNPEYRVGERVLVFVTVAPDGSQHTTALALGKYTLVDRPGGTRAIRLLPADLMIQGAGGAAAADSVRNEEHRLSALRAYVHTVATTAPQARTRKPLQGSSAAARLRLEPRTEFILLNPHSRWFEPDDGATIGFPVDVIGDAALGPAVSLQAVDEALAAWTAVVNSPLHLVRGGDAEPAPFAGCPDDNRIVFNDPFGELDNPRSCRGVLAVGGFCNSGETRTIKSNTYRRIITGKLTFNDGWGDCPIWTACNLAEIMTHELGHTIGLGHSNDETATMAREAHFDGRCAALAADDEVAIEFVYPFPPTPTVTPSTTPSPAPTATVTRTGTSTRTPSRTVTFTRSLTPTRTRTPTRSSTPTRTRTPGATATSSSTPSATATLSVSATPSPSATGTATPPPTETITATATPTVPPPPRSWLEILLDAVRQVLDALRRGRVLSSRV
jgi:hypothetical protein